MCSKLKKMFEGIENTRGSFLLWLFAFVAIVTIRNFLESVLEFPQEIGFTSEKFASILAFFNHFILFYIAQFLVFAIAISLLTKERIEKVSKVVIVFWMLTISVPIIDYFFSGGQGYPMRYFTTIKDLIYSLVNAFNPRANFWVNSGKNGEMTLITTPGLRIEAFIACLLTFFYVLIKTKKFLKSVVGMILIYLILIFYSGGAQVIFAELSVKLFPNYYPDFEDSAYHKAFYYPSLVGGAFIDSSSQKQALVLLFLILFTLIIWCYLYDATKFKMVLKNIKYLISLHYCSLTLYGMLACYFMLKDKLPNAFSFSLDYLAALGLCISVFFASQAIEIVKDLLAWQNSNIGKHTIYSPTSVYEYKALCLIYFLLAIYFAFNVCYSGFLVVLMFIVFSLLANLPILKLESFFPLNMLIIASNALLTFIAGATFIAGEGVFEIVPLKFMLFVFIFSFLVANVLAMGRLESYKEVGMITLSTLLREKLRKFIIISLVLVGYTLAPLILGVSKLLIIPLFLGICSCFFMIRKKHSEIYLSLIHLIYLAFTLYSIA